MRRLAPLLPLILLIAAPHAAQAAKKNACTSASGKKIVKLDGKVLQSLRSGQYYAYRHSGGTWTFCNSKAGPKTAFKSFNFDLSGQKYTGVKLLARPGKCVALQLRPQKGGVPAVPTIDWRGAGEAGSSVHQIEFTAPGATITKVELSSTCLLGMAYVSAAGSRAIQLNPVIPPNVLQETIRLSDKSTDADLRALKLAGDTVSWTDAGEKQTKVYSGLVQR